jgi:hypothetical protein
MNYEWNFPALEVVKNKDSLINVIKTAHWVYSVENNGYVASIHGAVDLSDPNPASFTPYENVTKEQVQGWVEEAFGQKTLDDMKFNLNELLAQQQTPTNEVLAPPWAVSENEV